MVPEFHSGKFNIDELTVWPGMTEEDLHCKNSDTKYRYFHSGLHSAFYSKGILSVDNSPFMAELHFLNKKISSILLRPNIQYPKSMSNPYEKQRLRYAACCRWLFIRLGFPTNRTTEEYGYDFSWGTIAAITHLHPKDSCDAGYIIVRFRKSTV